MNLPILLKLLNFELFHVNSRHMYKSRSTTKTLEKKTLKECRNNSFCKESPFIGFSLYDPNKQIFCATCMIQRTLTLAGFPCPSFSTTRLTCSINMVTGTRSTVTGTLTINTPGLIPTYCKVKFTYIKYI